MSWYLPETTKSATKKFTILLTGAGVIFALMASAFINNVADLKAAEKQRNQNASLPAELQNVDYMYVNEKDQIVVDLQAIPVNYENLLDKYEDDELDGRTFIYEGITVLPGSERRALDQQRHQEEMEVQGGPYTAPLRQCSELADADVAAVSVCTPVLRSLATLSNDQRRSMTPPRSSHTLMNQ